MKVKINYKQVKGLTDALNKHPERCLDALYVTSSVIASDLEAKARKNAKWTDRTGQARRNIEGSSEKTDNKVTIKLEGYAEQNNKEYFQYLEYAKQKKYAILEPTLKENKDEVINRYAKSLKAVGLDI